MCVRLRRNRGEVFTLKERKKWLFKKTFLNSHFLGDRKKASEWTNRTEPKAFGSGYPKAYIGTSSGEVCS
jgi:hypothetical protein